MSPVKHKKIEKTSTMNFIVNFCSIFALIYVIALLVIANIFGADSGAGLASLSCALPNVGSCGTDAEKESVSVAPAVLFPVSASESGNGYLQIAVDDAGFAQKYIAVSLSGPRMLEISNIGADPHSFVIDGLKIDSGAIAPGQTKTIALENLPPNDQSYTFYSNTPGDDKAKFNGVITVTGQ